MGKKKEIRLSGTGGQGIILAGILLAEAAVFDGKEVVQTQSYGPEARGGASRAEVIISDGPIRYPKVITPHYLLLMSNEAVKRYASSLAPGGLVIVDSGVIKDMPEIEGRLLEIPLAKLAQEEIGNILTTNIVAVGALASASALVSKESLEKAIRHRLGRVAELNIRALHLGWEWGSTPHSQRACF